MTDELKELVEAARRIGMSQADKEDQRRSFAFGNTKIENDLITRQTIDAQAEALNEK